MPVAHPFDSSDQTNVDGSVGKFGGDEAAVLDVISPQSHL
jgi:hypothetical protein